MPAGRLVNGEVGTAAVLAGRKSVPASYVVYKDGATYYAESLTGGSDFSGADAATVAQSAWNSAPSGTTVFHKAATYSIASRLALNRSDIFLDAEPRTIFQATADIGTPFPSGWYGIVVFGDNLGTANQRENIRVRNITFDANSKAFTPAATIVGCKNIGFENCIFKNSGASAVGTVIVIGGNDSTISLIGAVTKIIKFIDCEFGPSASYGLYFDGGTEAPASPVIDGVWVNRSYVHDNNNAGIANAMRAGRLIARVRIRDSFFELNKKVAGAEQQAHVDDTTRVGWVDLLASGNYFGAAGSANCGGISDHNGIGIRLVDNYFDLGTFETTWWCAIGDARAISNRSERVRIHGNIIEGGGGMDFDSSKYVRICHNTFRRVRLQAIGSFGEHIETCIYDNDFIEGGQGVPTQEYHKAGISCGRGMDIRRNVFRDDQGTKTQLYGVHEVPGDIGTEVNIYESNDFTNTPGGASGGALVLQNYSYVVRNNRGFNPQGWATASPAVPATGVDETNTKGYPVLVYITGLGSGITAVGITDNAATLQSFTRTGEVGDFYRLEPGDKIRLTYTGSPTWKWYGL